MGVVCHEEPEYPGHMSETLQDFIQGLLTKAPESRLGSVASGGAHGVREHPWFDEFKWEKFRAGTLKPPITPNTKKWKKHFEGFGGVRRVKTYAGDNDPFYEF